MKYLQIITVVITSLLISGCQGNSQHNATSVNSEEHISDPVVMSLDEIKAKASDIQGLRSLLIDSNGEMITESYFESYSGDSLDHLRSVTKSVIGLLIGIAIDKQMIKSEHDPINQYLKGVNGLAKRHDPITIHHLLTMSSGFKWDESTVSTFNNWVVSSDPVAYVLDSPLSNDPGEKFAYNSATSHLLSVILTKASGMSTLEFANLHLFDPLNIDKLRWKKIRGYYNGGAGLELRPKDMIKLGQLVANGGTYEGNQILSTEWVEKLTNQQIPISTTQAYSYLWWISPEIPERNAMALGYRGQFIVVFPEMQTTVVATSNWRGPKAVNTTEGQFFKLLGKSIYPFLKE